MNKLLPGIILIAGLMGCTIQDGIADNNESNLRRETITKETSTLVYSYSEKSVPYGNNGIITLHLNFPSNLSPTLHLNSNSNETPVENGIVLDIIQDGPVLNNDGSIDLMIKIVFEAFLPGKVRINPIVIDMISIEEGPVPKISFELNPIIFDFPGDPSLIQLDSDNKDGPDKREMADLISIEDKPKLNPLILISVIAVVLALILIYFLRKKSVPEVIDNRAVLLKLREQFEKKYLNQTGPEDIRPAYGELRKIICLTPDILNKPDKKEDYLRECNRLYFPGKPLTGKAAENRLRDIFYGLSKGNEE